jgi:hypothetical protein
MRYLDLKSKKIKKIQNQAEIISNISDFMRMEALKFTNKDQSVRWLSYFCSDVY